MVGKFNDDLTKYANNSKRKTRIFSDISIRRSKEEQPADSDTENRKRILNEITVRVANGENIDEVASEIASNDEVKQQFDYYIKHGIKDLARIFKSWYETREKNKDKLQKIEFKEIG